MINPTLNDGKSESVDVKEYLAVLLKRKWLILVCFLLSMACTTAFLFTRQPIYRATARLFVSTSIGGMTADLVSESEKAFYPTTISVMQSQSMLRRVQQRMRKTPEELRENLASLRISRAGGATIILVTVDSPSKDFAREFANALCDEYLRFRDEEQAKLQEGHLLVLTREINRLSQELKVAQQRIIDYGRQNDLALLEKDPNVGTGNYLNLLRQLQSVNSQLTAVQSRKTRLDAQSDAAGIVALLAAEGKAEQEESVVQNLHVNVSSGQFGVGSAVVIQVDQSPELNHSTTVAADGTIEYGQLGKIQVHGLTPAGLASNIQQRLLQELQINATVNVTSPAPQMVAAGGDLAPAATGNRDDDDLAGWKDNQLSRSRNVVIDRPMLTVVPAKRAEILYNLENRRKDLQVKVEELSKIYRPKHPALIQAKNELASVGGSIDREISYLREKTAADLQILKERHAELNKQLDEAKDEAMGANVKLWQMANLRADASRVRGLYNALLQQLLKTDTLERRSRNVSVLEYAIVANDPVYPKKVKGLLMAALVGLGLGLALAYFIEYIDDSIKLAEEVERELQLPFLGMIPAAQWSPDDLTAHRLDKLKQQGGVAESYRVVRSAIIFSTPREKLRSILLTSAVPREGKTTTCVNLSIGFAQIEERVLLIDADLRRGEIHKYFGLERENGLADVLLGEKTPEQVIRQTNVPKLDVITSGTYPSNPAELLLGWRLKETLDWAHKNYDRVIIDSPPVMGIADSSILGSAVDGVLFVIWAGRTSRRYVRVAKMTAVSRGAKIFGFVLNNLEPGRVGYYHYYPYYYSYYSRGYYYAPKDGDKGKGGDIKGIEVPTPQGGEEKIDDVY
ncbi:MAG: hypothetical protein PCFJNLEI_00400 [Verrucomicrobiae bacterium]|nr:hypothetical protein [Verrucomicrobiae bacterium]